MKKLSISFIAVLAIAFAVSSSFTTKHSAKQNASTLSTAYFFSNEVDIVDPSQPEDMAKFTELVPYGSINALRTAHEICSEDDGEVICGVLFNYTAGDPNVLTDLESETYSFRFVE